jgi:hypothetical protein
MGWFTITILLPCLAPLLASLTFKLLTLPEGAEASPMKAFRDGQLCWTALGFCAAAQYWSDRDRGRHLLHNTFLTRSHYV